MQRVQYRLFLSLDCFMLSDKSGLLWVITLSLTSLLLFFTVPNLQLSFDWPLIAGEGWRIRTGNLAHTNLWHLLLNLGGLAILYSLFRDYLSGARLPLLMLLLWLAVGLGIWWWCPQTQWYMGLSGSLHGLFVWGQCRISATDAARRAGYYWQGWGSSWRWTSTMQERAHIHPDQCQGTHRLSSYRGQCRPVARPAPRITE